MKLQPNFTWQKYEGNPQDEKDQFQYQMGRQHNLVANSVNATIDDESYWPRERRTSETWIDGSPIFTQTYTVTLAAGLNNIPVNTTRIDQVISLSGIAQNAIPMTTYALPLPFVDADPGAFANQIKLYATPIHVVVDIDSAASPWVGYLAHVTMAYTKTR